MTAQSIPERRDAGGAERALALTDRVWFKVKTSDRRAVATELRGEELPDWVLASRGSWWLEAAGRRQGDSAQRDFSAVLEKECTTGKTVSALHLLPGDKDWKRLALEQAYAWRIDMKHMVIRWVAASLTSGRAATAEFRKHRITALVRAENGHEGYLAIVAESVPDPAMFALLWTASRESRATTGKRSPRQSPGSSRALVRSSGRRCSRRRSRARSSSWLTMTEVQAHSPIPGRAPEARAEAATVRVRVRLFWRPCERVA